MSLISRITTYLFGPPRDLRAEGRAYAEKALDRAAFHPDELWAQADGFPGDDMSDFDQGIADVLAERGHLHPADPRPDIEIPAPTFK